MQLLNLVTSSKLLIMEAESYIGIGEGDMLDARLMSEDGKNCFTDSIWVYPSEGLPEATRGLLVRSGAELVPLSAVYRGAR